MFNYCMIVLWEHPAFTLVTNVDTLELVLRVGDEDSGNLSTTSIIHHPEMS